MAKSGFHRALAPRQVEGEEPQRLDPAPLNEGVRLDASALQVPLGAAVKLENCRFEEKGIRKDFGYTSIGGGATSEVLGLAEHKFIDSDELFHRLVRIIRNDNGKPELYAWDGSDWVLVDTATEDIEDKPLVMFSTQGKLVMTEGTQILAWSEEPVTNLIEHDFPSGNDLVAVGDETSVTVSDADAFDGEYTLHYSVSINGTQTADKMVTLGFYHEDNKIGEKSYLVPSGVLSDSWDEESAEFFRPSVEDGDVFKIKVEAIDVTTNKIQDSFGSGGGTTVDEVANKSVVAEADGQEYVYVHELTLPAYAGIGVVPEATIGYYYRKDSAQAWTLEETRTFSNPSDENRTLTIETHITIPDLDDAAQFGMKLEDFNRAGTSNNPQHVSYTTGVTVSVQGFNKSADGDSFAGETHEQRTGTTSDFSELSSDAPAASFIFPFGDRLLALQDDGNPQKLSWSVDGDITDWTGSGSGSTSLLDARSDPLDDLVAMGSVASNVAVLLRERSMMRVQETGNTVLAISVTHWIEGIGTESPLSVKQVRDGIMFLGHDLQVYYFNGSAAPQPVGDPIKEEILQEVSEGDLDRVEATFDPVFGEYWLKTPERVWVFALDEFLERQKLKWRSKDIQPQRLATVSRIF